MKLSIGKKLGLSSLVGIVLVAGMIIGQRYLNSSILSIHAQSVLETADRQHLQAGQQAFQQAVAANAALLLAADATHLAEGKSRLQQSLVSATGEFAASSHDENAENKARLDRLSVLVADFAAVAETVEGRQAIILRLRDQHRDLEAQWDDSYNAAQLTVQIMAREQDREIIAKLNTANNLASAARLAFWRYLSTSEQALQAKLEGYVDGVASQLAEVKKLDTDALYAEPVDAMTRIITSLKPVMIDAVAARQQQDAIMTEKAGPAIEAVSQLIDEAFALAGKSAEAKAEATASTIRTANTISLVAGLLVMLVLAGTAALAMLSVARPLRRIATVLSRLGAGERDLVVPYVNRGDEIGETADAAETFRQNLNRLALLEADQREADARLVRERAAAMVDLADRFETSVGGIVGVVSTAAGELENSARSMTITADRTRQRSSKVAQVSTETTSNINTVAAAADQLSQSVTEIGQLVERSGRIAGEAEAEAGVAREKIAALAEASSGIGAIVGLINNIAGQTNLLALNATIEAARAGEAGKGFAIVAQEVKNLAAQTGKATHEIASQITSVQNLTADSVASITAIGNVIREIAAIGGSIASAVTEQNAATDEIARNVREAATGAADVSGTIHDVENAAGESGAAASQVLAASARLSEQSSALRQEVSRFLDTVRTA